MGKYERIIDQLPKLLNTEPAFQVKIDAVKAVIKKERGTLNASALAREFELLRAEKDVLDAQASKLNVQLEAISQLLLDQFKTEDLSSVKLQSGQSISTYYEPYAKVEDSVKLAQWCKNTGRAGLLTVNWQKINMITKERLLAGEPEPDGVKAHSIPRIRLLRGSSRASEIDTATVEVEEWSPES